VSTVEKQLKKLKTAIGTLADAVSEEFDEMNQKIASQHDDDPRIA
jgi:hypothetical protein